MVVNLLENAAKYARHPSIALSVNDQRVCIEVSDEGRGFLKQTWSVCSIRSFALRPHATAIPVGWGLGSRRHGRLCASRAVN